MSRHFSVLGAVLRKDLQALWPLAVLTVALGVINALYPALDRLTQGLFPTAVHLLCALLIVAAVHQDSTSDVRRDWLTRPVSRGDLLLAKAAFVVLLVFVPIVLAKLGANLANGYSAGEALLAATTIDPVLVLVGLPALIAIAATTATPLQAIAVAIGLFAGILLIVATGIAAGVYSFGPEIAVLGTGWIGLVIVAIATAGATIAVLGLEYGFRKTTAARTVFLGAIVLLLGAPALLSRGDILALQSVLAEAAPPSSFALTLLPGCLPATTIAATGNTGGHASAERPPVEGETWDRLAAAAGPDAISFATPFTLRGVPHEWRPEVSAVELVYLNGGGKILERLPAARFTAVWKPDAADRPEGSHYWVLPRQAYRRLAQHGDVRLRLDYSLSLLQPRVAQIPVDGRRREIAGVGYCSAALDGRRNRVLVDCFEHGRRPALLAAELIGRPDTRADTGFPDYAPVWLQALSSARYSLALPDGSAAATRVKLTAYEARSHFNRSVSARGILGGPPAACPAPAP
jgi:hypothetical protein